jgi:O-antigen/teichoic acid export membrane protein
MSTENKNNYVGNSFWILLEKASRIISGILVGILVVRYLGDQQYGIISLGLSIVGVLTIISTLGLDSLVVREIITRKEQSDIILGTSFTLRFLGSIMVVLLTTAWAYLNKPIDIVLIFFLLSISIVFQSFAVIDFFFQSQVKGKITAINQVITLSVSAVAKLSLIYFEAELIWFACMAALEAGVSAVLQIYFYHQQGYQIFRWKFERLEAKNLLVLAIPLIISTAIQMLYLNADTLLIDKLLNNMGLVGQYNAGLRISQASYFIPVAICAAVFPGIVNNRNNRTLQLTRLTQLYSLMLWLAIGIIVGSQLLGDWVIGLLYGHKFPESAGVFKIHVLGSIPVFWGTAWAMWMLAEQKQKYVVAMQVLIAFTVLILDYFLIPKIGISGAASSVVIGLFVAQLYMVIGYKPKENLPIFLKAINPKNLLEIIKYTKNKES